MENSLSKEQREDIHKRSYPLDEILSKIEERISGERGAYAVAQTDCFAECRIREKCTVIDRFILPDEFSADVVFEYLRSKGVWEARCSKRRGKYLCVLQIDNLKR